MSKLTLKNLKNKFPDPQVIYDEFHKSPEGEEAWKEAWQLQGEDPMDGAIDGADLVVQAMQQWVTELVSDKNYEKADEWFEQYAEELNEMVFAGLT